MLQKQGSTPIIACISVPGRLPGRPVTCLIFVSLLPSVPAVWIAHHKQRDERESPLVRLVFVNTRRKGMLPRTKKKHWSIAVFVGFASALCGLLFKCRNTKKLWGWVRMFGGCFSYLCRSAVGIISYHRETLTDFDQKDTVKRLPQPLPLETSNTAHSLLLGLTGLT